MPEHRKALLLLAARASSPAEFADQLGLTVEALYKARSPRRRPRCGSLRWSRAPPMAPGRAMRVRCVAGAVDLVLVPAAVTSGAWPSVCQHCGRSG